VLDYLCLSELNAVDKAIAWIRGQAIFHCNWVESLSIITDFWKLTLKWCTDIIDPIGDFTCKAIRPLSQTIHEFFPWIGHLFACWTDQLRVPVVVAKGLGRMYPMFATRRCKWPVRPLREMTIRD
jgi:hypothetical protein